MSGQPEVAVIGGGIGGLTTALALRGAGIPVTVYERTARPRADRAGHGLILWHNAVLALRQAGMGRAVEKIGHPIDAYAFRSARGSTLARWDLSRRTPEYGAPPYAVSRPELHRVLTEAVSDSLRTGMACTGFRQDADGVTVRFDDGREVRADVLIGADGLRSAVRRSLMPHERPPRYAGYTAYQGVVHVPDLALEPGLFTNTFGRGRWFVTYPLGDGNAYWDGVLDERTARRLRSFGEPAASVIAREFDGWPAPIPHLIAATDPDALAPVDIFDRDPVERWTDRRVTLLGDAAHPMTFNLGQGVGQAVEDAVVLAQELARAHGDPGAALLRYEGRRVERTTRMVRRSRANGSFIRRRHPVMCALRNGFVRVAFERLVYRKTYHLTMDTDF